MHILFTPRSWCPSWRVSLILPAIVVVATLMTGALGESDRTFGPPSGAFHDKAVSATPAAQRANGSGQSAVDGKPDPKSTSAETEVHRRFLMAVILHGLAGHPFGFLR